MKLRVLFVVLFVAFIGFPGCKTNEPDLLPGSASSPPQITGMIPSVVNPGAQGIIGHIQGNNFTSILSVSLGDGIILQQFTIINSNDIYVFFSVSRGAPPGPKNIVVTTSAGTGSSSTVFRVDDNQLPEAKIKVTPGRGIKETAFRFDGSGSRDDGNIVQYKWRFGDGRTENGRIVTHKYNRGGNFVVVLTVTDNRNATAETERDLDVAASRLPIAQFKITPSSGDVNTTFHFDGTFSRDLDGRVARYIWIFGDGASANGSEVNHKFSRGASYPVTLRIIDNTGEEDIVSQFLRVEDGPDVPPPGGGPGPCIAGARNRGLIFGTVIGVEGQNAIVQLPADSTCQNSFYLCGDMRKASPENFYGIIRSMEDRGNGVFSIFNDCPFRWPPPIGEQVFLIFKKCSDNFCP